VSHPPAGLTWHGYLVQLLHIASSIEHALMVQYLFAAYSLNDGVESSEFRKKVVLWRNLILSIAKEEMGHLLTVQNVLCLLGGPVELVRENFPWDSEFYPFEFRLERLTVGCLACYLYAEMSNGVPDLPQELKPLAQSAEKAAQRHIQRRSEGIRKPLPDLQRPGLHQIGILYQRIIEILADRHKIPNSVLDHGSVRFQASMDEWGRGYGAVITKEGAYAATRVADGGHASANFRKRREEIEDTATHANTIIETAATRQQAIDALMSIVEQGDASDTRSAGSHFERLGLIMTQLLNLRARRGDHWEPPTHFVADDPHTALSNERSDDSTITYAYSATWANLFNLRYRMLLMYLTHSFQIARDGRRAYLRGAIMHQVFAEMYNLKAIAGILVRLPLKDPSNALRAGPPFQMPYTLALPMEAIDRWRLHRDLVRGALQLNRDLQNAKQSSNSVAQLRLLSLMQDLDGGRNFEMM
jgi:hypothetical protein